MIDSDYTFEPAGPLHLTVVAASILLPIALARITRQSERAATRIRYAHGVLLVAVATAHYGFQAHAWFSGHPMRLATLLPMHLCDWSLIACVLSCFRRIAEQPPRSLAFDMAYYLVFAGSIHGLLTPDIDQNTPMHWVILFFIFHGGLISCVLYLLFGTGYRPSEGSVRKVFGVLQLYLLAALAVNALFNTNFGYLAEKPEHYSVMQHLFPWPWYIVQLEGLALITLSLAYAPFWFLKHRSRKDF